VNTVLFLFCYSLYKTVNPQWSAPNKPWGLILSKLESVSNSWFMPFILAFSLPFLKKSCIFLWYESLL